jgi:CDP-6-deoxy-D-xylo-4-hexulose-3-dehydrase
MFYDLASSSWGEEEIAALHRVIDGGQLTVGPSVRKFEEDFARKFGIRHALMVSSGSAANLVGLATLFYKKDRPLQRGDEVIVPSIPPDTHPLQHTGCASRDVELECQLASRVERAWPRTRMVVAVSILRQPGGAILRDLRSTACICSKTT